MINDKKLIQEELNALFNNLIGPVAIGTVVASFCFFYLKADINNSILGIWLLLIYIGGGARLLIKFLYSRNRFDHKKILLSYQIVTNFVATVWGSLSLIILNKLPIEKEVFIVAIILGLASGGAISHIANRFTAVYYSSSIVVFHMIKTAIEQHEDWYLLFFAEGLFVFLIFQMVQKFHYLFKNSQKMAIELQDKIDLEKQLQTEKLKALQKTKLASLGEMAAGIAHEINNPLAISLGRLQVIKKSFEKSDKSPEFYSHQIEEVYKSNKRVADIVQSMRDLSRMKEEVELQEFSVNSLIETVQPFFLTKFSQGNIEIIDDTDDCLIRADKSELSQVLLNLFSNSFDAIKEKDDKRWIKLETIIKDEYINLRITDSGLTSDLSDIEKIFEPFYTTKEIGEGSGLGLSLSKSIMERNGGNLSINKDSINTCFIMSIKKV